MSNKIVNLFGEEIQENQEIQEENDAMITTQEKVSAMRLSEERLCNLIVFVILDQMSIARQAMDLLIERGESGDDQAGIVTALCDIKDRKNFLKYIGEIQLWVERHIKYIKNPLEIFDKRYYTLVQDALFIIYYDDYDKSNFTGSQYAVLCEQKYSVDWKE